jgi:hypothetical protein
MLGTWILIVGVLYFGLLFNATMLAISGLGLLTPILGALGHNLGSVAVVLNSARLLRFRINQGDIRHADAAMVGLEPSKPGSALCTHTRVDLHST